MFGWMLVAAAATALAEVPPRLTCAAEQTVGLHDYPHNAEAYEAVEFFESRFAVEVNQALTRYLAETTDIDVYVTLRQDDDDLVELSCVRVRGEGDVPGLSCTNNPPAQLLLVNLDNLRFTRTAIGGWTFAAAGEVAAGGESIYVEYGVCQSD